MRFGIIEYFMLALTFAFSTVTVVYVVKDENINFVYDVTRVIVLFFLLCIGRIGYLTYPIIQKYIKDDEKKGKV